MIHRISALVARIYALLNRFESLPILLVRIALGVGFAITGYGKLANHAQTVTNFTNLHVPMAAFNAWFVGGVEFFGGILLVVGLGTRIFALMLSFTMLVAILTAVLPGLDHWYDLTTKFLDTEVLAMVTLLWLVFSGPGVLSFDHLVAKQLAPPPPPKPAA